MEFLWEGVMAITPQQFVMYLIGGLLIWLAVKKEYEPALLLPMGFGAIMVNLPLSGVINQVTEGIGETQGIIQWLFETTISASEALPILLFIGIGAMIDFGPLLSQPIMFLFGAAAQFGIFFAICAASLMGFELRDAASIGIIGAADGPTSILVSQIMHSNYVGAIAVAAYSYMALVPNRPAICDPSGDDEKRTPDSHDLQSEKCVQNDQDRISDCGYYHCRTDFSGIGGAGRISDVWKPDPRVRRASGTFPDGTERAGKPDYPAAWHHDFVQYACGRVCAG